MALCALRSSLGWQALSISSGLTWDLTSLENWKYPGWNSKQALYTEIKERQKEAEHSRLVGGRFNKKGNLRGLSSLATRWVDLCTCHQSVKSLYKGLSWAHSRILTRWLMSNSWVNQPSRPLDNLSIMDFPRHSPSRLRASTCLWFLYQPLCSLGLPVFDSVAISPNSLWAPSEPSLALETSDSSVHACRVASHTAWAQRLFVDYGGNFY